MDAELRRVASVLAGVGYHVTGITFDLFPPEDGVAGWGLLRNGQSVRFFVPTDPDSPVVVGHA